MLDVRRAHVFAAAPALIAGAAWHSLLRRRLVRRTRPERAVVVYRAHGESVSQGVADALSAVGLSPIISKAALPHGSPSERRSREGRSMA